jgi:hypothetical protein
MAARIKKSHYMFVVLRERNGEYEYYHRSVHEIPDAKRTTMKKYAERYLKEFYGGKREKDDGGYYFHGGAVFVRIQQYHAIEQKEYGVLREYLYM